MKEVGSILKNLDPSKSPGFDGLTSRLLKDVASEISCPITDIFNKTLTSGIFPTEGKDSNLTPVFKSGQKDVVTNYRGTALLPVFSRRCWTQSEGHHGKKIKNGSFASDLRFVHISRCAIKIPEEIV